MLSMIIPTYNEKENIEQIIERIFKVYDDNKIDGEVIVVDDNSPDGTWKIVQDMKNPKYKLIRRIDEKGLASALARGIAEAKGNIIVWLDCDLGIPPEDIPRLVEKLDKYDVVIGSRYVKGGKDLRSKLRIAYSFVLDGFANWFFEQLKPRYLTSVTHFLFSPFL